MAQAQPPPKQDLGQPIAWDDHDLATLSTVSQADRKAAAALWRQTAPPALKALLQAEVMESHPDQGGQP